MTDRELLELAAMAVGLTGTWSRTIGGWDCLVLDAPQHPWQPLHDDGDALRLVVGLRIELVFVEDAVRTYAGHRFYGESLAGGDLQSATRRAIVRAAAEIGRQREAGGEHG